ncbi:hypothetical protein baBA2_000075 [Borrelia anserina]|uniref:Uncharacterized protein n=2 Tax=Borrelia anserina TaxID=143 RepID=W5SLK5_BORAN|nr:hypothetical protein [Borrelia anserina]AHH08039.1 Hypothetical protein BAN_0107400 [Borrelia anserina BA2]APR64589.1 hypothetical protein N187_00370 [Borrelia anserina Es]UPA06502.1 hypothetical protein baBA2_000075 [Borrelia anserina]
MTKIATLLLTFIMPSAYGQRYFISDAFFNKYQEIHEIPKTGFYIEYTTIDEIEKFILFKDSKLIKYKTQKIIEDNKKKLTFYTEKDIKTKEEIYDNLNNKIQEIKYSPKGIILESVDYFYKNNDLTHKEIKILNQKPKTIHYMKDTNGKLLKITGSDFQVWNYGTNGEIKSTYFDIKKSRTKVIRYDDQKRNLECITLGNDKIKYREKNKYLDNNEIINTAEEGEIKTISKYKDKNLIRKEVYKNNEITEISDLEYNESGNVIFENITAKRNKKEYNTKTKYEYDFNNKLKSKTTYENDLILLKTDYFNDNEYEQEIYYNGNPILKVRYKNDEIIEEINK